MTRFSVRVVAGILLILAISAATFARLSAQQESSPSAHQKLSFDGDTALWTVAIKPDKTADFEQIMTKMRKALLTSADPMRRQQAAGWKVMRIAKPLGDGNIAYVHLIHPVVSGADYTIMQTLYDAYPDERQALYDQYRGAFVHSLAMSAGSIAVDLSAERP
ncbi:MAG TPA: hypothetical protein VI485_13835 [Vicinamibacterales bacterium]|nr:hypothetical protein [Vicinamibacterales bacterium]